MRLLRHQKLAIVELLACFHSPSLVKTEMQERYGLTLELSQIVLYDPTTRAGATLSRELREAFFRIRSAYCEDRSAIAIAHSTYRLWCLQRMYDEVQDARVKNVVLAMQILEQAAKEAGGMFTNRREISGPGGKAIRIGPPPAMDYETLRKLPAEELIRLHRESLGPDGLESRHLQEWRAEQTRKLADQIRELEE